MSVAAKMALAHTAGQETTRCDLCGADDAAVIFKGEQWQGAAPDGVALVRCRRCRLMYLNPRPTRDMIANFYPDDYAPFRPAIEDERLPLMRWMRRHKLVKRRQLLEHFSGRRRGRVLDVGCATGLFLHEMQHAGWDAVGVEPTTTAANYARTRFGLNVVEGTLAGAELTPASFDVVTFWDVLEHTFSPRAELMRSASLLRPGGLIAINVPNWNSFDRRWWGPHWIGYDPPRHLYVFTRETLARLLNEAGFQIVDWLCFMPSYFPFVESFTRWLRAHAPRLTAPIARTLNVPGMRFAFEPALNVANRTRRGVVISVFARKADAL